MEYEKEIAIMARALNDEQIENILPGYKNIYNQIKSMRNYAELYYCKYIDTRDSYVYRCKNKEYSNITMNNVFSILGKRGAGKSSILLTLKNNIEENKHLKAVKGKEYKNNVDIVLPIILPIILPETMRNKGDMMGWILGCFKEIVDELSKVEAEKYNKEKNNGVNFGNCRKDEENTEVRKKYNEVLKQYSYTRKDYADIIKDNYTGLKEYIDKSRKILDPENELKRSFFEFINQLIKIKKESGTNKETPMIYMFLDDIDLTKNHCNEILGVISRYLCHPNIIVFVSGDYEIFETEQFMSYMKGSNLIELVVSPVDNNKYGEKLFNENRMLARDALKKIMPPAYRYKLRSLSAEKRLDFYYKSETDEDENESDKKNKGKALKDLLEEKFKDFNPDQSKKEHLEVINAYGLIFDEMPRGIMNVYYALNNMEDNSILKPSEKELDEDEKKESEKKIEDYISNFKNFINTIINSSAILSKYEDEINACIQINNPFTETFVNYRRLIKKINQNNDEYYVNKEIEGIINHETIIVLIFAHFIESIVGVIDKNRKVHSQKQVWDILSQKESLFNDNDKAKLKFKIYPQIEDTNFIFNLYEAMLSNDALNIMPTMDNLYLKDYSLKFYFEKIISEDNIIEKNSINNIFLENISSIGKEDYEWLEEKFKVVYYHRNFLSMMFNKAVNATKKHNFNYNYIIRTKFNISFYNNILNKLRNKEINSNTDDYIDIYEEISIDKEKVKEDVRKAIVKLIEIIEEEIKSTVDNLTYSSIKKQEKFNCSELEENIDRIFLKLSIDKNCENESKYKEIIHVLVLCKVIKGLGKIGEYELDYFVYFQLLHLRLKDDFVYKNWCDSRRNISPLTLVLEE